jgi:hypothetical protein
MELYVPLLEFNSDAERVQNSDPKADTAEQHPTPKHQPELIPSDRAQRCSDTHFTRTPRHRVRDYSVDSDGGKQKGETGEHAQQHGPETGLT